MVRSVHLVGSVSLDTVKEVFETTGRLIGPSLHRVPDGEPGGRRLWISWQYPLLRANPFLKAAEGSPPPVTKGSNFRLLDLANGVRPNEVRFSELGYAREARASYLDFTRARDAGKLPADARFQVCLPTPLAVMATYMSPGALAAVEPAYEKAMLREVQMLAEEIPNHDLCIQWDVCREMYLWDGGLPSLPNPFKGHEQQEILARMRRLCDAVPKEIELGIHLCYGDFGAVHMFQPRDASKLVSFANALAREITHPLAYVHMPVPIERHDEAYFAPMKDLHLPQGCQLYLGLLHLADGIEGARARIAAAERYAPPFGVAAECGLGRSKTPEMIERILRLHADAAAD